MKAVGYRIPGAITDAASLVDIELLAPVPTGRESGAAKGKFVLEGF